MRRWLLVIFTIAATSLAAIFAFDSIVLKLTTIIAGTCLVLRLSKIVPPFVPTFLLWTLPPLLLDSLDKKFGLPIQMDDQQHDQIQSIDTMPLPVCTYTLGEKTLGLY